ncbi:Putative nicotinamide N-methyltransferase [Taphrina deformans PYCC 5710]|uniref:Nicotinamide N-methyltransferase n=1 Tax=Taphrina deformans (strain PYCC 5710 / ATCC 11124 / CBS 356.35 / IMI 108563 / JCM 9778 / NBRC 8474) TaxID=1097556 RepID=R4XET8_TAPDE|nr:Putative nicotinamide N-methyltransferase [Taphrina deformans PYCC 5710]|eukprot:CCG82991.1 Putative nicotinamide N-methyltransferase [Taphrina deformans PYCC 5710]
MSDEEYDGLDMFHEEDTPLPDPVFQSFERLDGQSLSVRLVGQSPLWGHLLWSAGKIMANYLDQNISIIKGKNVLELGAAGALPSLISALNSAKLVVATDYPDADLLYNMQYNLDHCPGIDHDRVFAEGYIWGREVDELLSKTKQEKYDLLLLSDLVFNHQAHPDLLKTCRSCLSDRPGSQVLVFYTHHRPHLADKDDAFLALAPEYGFRVEKVVEDVSEKNVMFEEDGGSREVRSTVHGYRFTWF